MEWINRSSGVRPGGLKHRLFERSLDEHAPFDYERIDRRHS